MALPGDKTTYSTANVRWTLSIARQMIQHQFDIDGDLTLILEPTYSYAEFSEEEAEGFDLTELEIPMEISSAKIMAASVVFQAMLKPTFREGHTLSATGSSTINLPDDDAAPLSILLSIIHGNTKNVPRRIDLELFCEISVLVDKYQLHQAVSAHSQNWASTMTSFPLMPSYNEMLQNLCICCVWHRYGDLEQLIDYYMLLSSGWIGEERNPDLPIPSKIFEHANNRRLQALERFFSEVKAYVAKYYGESKQCNRNNKIMQYACDAMVLGELIHSLARAGMWPIPSAPFKGFSIWDLERIIKKIEIRTMCSYSPPRHWVLSRKHADPKKDLYAIWIAMIYRELGPRDRGEIEQLLPRLNIEPSHSNEITGP